MTPKQEPSGLTRGVSVLLTQLVTNALKVAGLIVAGNELLFRKDLRPVALAEAAFMMAGGQFSEQILVAVLDRLLGRPGVQPDEEQENAPPRPTRTTTKVKGRPKRRHR